MFRIGDRVAYPLHGAGLVQAIEEREVLGVTGAYYVLLFEEENLRMLIPVSRAQEVRLRPIASKEQAEQILFFLRERCGPEVETTWNQRYRANLEKLKTGELFAMAEVVRSLSAREMKRGLSIGEIRMLQSARKHLAGELSLAKGVQRSLMEERLEEILRRGDLCENEA